MDDAHARYVEDAYAERDDIVRSLARRFDGLDAEEHVDEAYAQCCAADVTDREHAVRWVARAANNLAIDTKRGHTITRRYAPQLVAPGTTDSAEDRYLDTELQQRVAAAVEAMPAREREVMQAFAEGARNSEISKRVGRSVYAVKHVIARSLKQLREQLRDAELALIAYCSRRRRTVEAAVVVSPAMFAALPAAAIALSMTLPLLEQGAAFALRLQQHGPQKGVYLLPDIEDVRRMSYVGIIGRTDRSTEPDDGKHDALVRVSREVEFHADKAVDSVPKHPKAEATPPGHRAWVKPGDGRPTWVEYEPAPDDPVGDATYCLTHPVITPERIYCEQPPN